MQQQQVAAAPSSWRNLFASVSLLRVLNKLVKGKNSRIMVCSVHRTRLTRDWLTALLTASLQMLVVFKSAPILKRALRVRHALHQLYVLKLLKLQCKYLGRQWRKNNMKTLSAIYALVRHRLTDDWAYGNELEGRLSGLGGSAIGGAAAGVNLDFQSEESSLRIAVERFNQRRYPSLSAPPAPSCPTPSPPPCAASQPSADADADERAAFLRWWSSVAAKEKAAVTGDEAAVGELLPLETDASAYLAHQLPNVQLSEQFERSYEHWLAAEVFDPRRALRWDALLASTPPPSLAPAP